MEKELTHEERKKVALFLEVGHDLDDVLELHTDREFFVIGEYDIEFNQTGFRHAFWSQREAYRFMPELEKGKHFQREYTSFMGFPVKFSDFLNRIVSSGFEKNPLRHFEHEIISRQLETHPVDKYFDACERYETLSELYYDLVENNTGKNFPLMDLTSTSLDGLKHDIMYARKRNKIPKSVFMMEDTILTALARAEEYFYNT